MDWKNTRRIAREFFVLVPLLGAIDADLRARRGDQPLVYGPSNYDGRSNLEVLQEGEERKNILYEHERETLRRREDLVKKGVFYGYHGLTTGYILSHLLF